MFLSVPIKYSVHFRPLYASIALLHSQENCRLFTRPSSSKIGPYFCIKPTSKATRTSNIILSSCAELASRHHMSTTNSVFTPISSSPDERRIFATLDRFLAEQDGFEWHHFRVGSYNAIVQKGVQLKYDDNVMSVVILNTPTWFESTYRESLVKQYRKGETIEEFAKRIGPNPVRSFFEKRFEEIVEALKPIRAVAICDFEPLVHRLPMVSLQACGHISGATYFYPVKDPIDAKTGKKKLHMGLSLHPKYGGHFSFRGVIVFPDVRLLDSYKENAPIRTLKSEESVEEALKLFNDSYFDNRYRDCGSPLKKHGELQLKYFNTPPEKRWSLIAHWFRE